MTKTLVNENLTNPDQQLRNRQANTVAGQASWGGEGPPGKHCRDCRWWCVGGTKFFASGMVRPGPCDKYRQLTNGRKGAPVPYYAKACKFYEDRPGGSAAVTGR